MIHLVRPGQATETLGPDDALADKLVDRVLAWAAATEKTSPLARVRGPSSRGARGAGSLDPTRSAGSRLLPCQGRGGPRLRRNRHHPLRLALDFRCNHSNRTPGRRGAGRADAPASSARGRSAAGIAAAPASAPAPVASGTTVTTRFVWRSTSASTAPTGPSAAGELLAALAAAADSTSAPVSPGDGAASRTPVPGPAPRSRRGPAREAVTPSAPAHRRNGETSRRACARIVRHVLAGGMSRIRVACSPATLPGGRQRSTHLAGEGIHGSTNDSRRPSVRPGDRGGRVGFLCARECH